jgi:hypothetical protein
MESSSAGTSVLATPDLFKIVLLGEGAVGKSSILLRYTADKFIENHESTIQVVNSNFNIHSPFLFRPPLPPKRSTSTATKLSLMCGTPQVKRSFTHWVRFTTAEVTALYSYSTLLIRILFNGYVAILYFSLTKFLGKELGN